MKNMNINFITWVTTVLINIGLTLNLDFRIVDTLNICCKN